MCLNVQMLLYSAVHKLVPTTPEKTLRSGWFLAACNAFPRTDALKWRILVENGVHTRAWYTALIHRWYTVGVSSKATRAFGC